MTQVIAMNENVRNVMSLGSVDDWGEVKEAELYTKTGYTYLWDEIVAPRHKAIVDSNGRLISVVGKNYNLVQNRDIIPQYEDAIMRSNLDTNGIQRNIQYSHSGARTVVDYTFPSHRVAITDGDELDLKISVLNSYDGSWKFMSMVGAFRLLCTNGQIIGNSFSSYYGKHTKSLNVGDAIRKLETALDVYLHNVELWKQYPTTKLSIKDANRILLNLAGDNDKLMELLHSTYLKYVHQMGQNLWALYNAMTDWSTHTEVRNESNRANTVLLREAKVRQVLPMIEELRKVA